MTDVIRKEVGDRRGGAIRKEGAAIGSMCIEPFMKGVNDDNEEERRERRALREAL